MGGVTPPSIPRVAGAAGGGVPPHFVLQLLLRWGVYPPLGQAWAGPGPGRAGPKGPGRARALSKFGISEERRFFFFPEKMT